MSFFFPTKTLHFLRGWGAQTRTLLDFFFFICLIAHFSFKKGKHSMVWASQISRYFFLLLCTPNNRLVVYGSCHSWNLVEKATLSSPLQLVPTMWHFCEKERMRKRQRKEGRKRYGRKVGKKERKIMLWEEYPWSQWTTFTGRRGKEDLPLFVSAVYS